MTQGALADDGQSQSAASVLEAVDGILDVVRRDADDIERERRLTDEVVSALRSTGINRMVIPTELGGIGAHPWQLYEVFERIAAVDGSTGWTAAIGAGTNVFAGYLPESSAKQVFADVDASNASIFAPSGMLVRDQGSWVLTGRWTFSSNCQHSAWIVVGALVQSADGSVEPEPRLVFLRAQDVTIHDTWHVAGMRGTGSHDTAVDGLVVDLDHSCRFSDVAWPEGPLWRMPIFNVLVPCLAVVTLGIARGALDELIGQVPSAPNPYRAPLTEDPVAMADLATADAALRAARAGLRQAIDDVWGAAEQAIPVARSLQARVLASCVHAGATAVDVTSTAHRLGGGRAAYAKSRLSRALRDVETARQHAVFGRGLLAPYGRLVAGVDEPMLPFIA